MEPRLLLSTYVVDNTADSGPGSLRAAILAADGDLTPATANIEFEIPASTAADLDVPVPGFDPATQDWTITLASPLPAITRPMTIDGYSQGEVAVPYRYPNAVSLAIQTLTVLGSPTGGSFTLTTSFPLPSGTTEAIPYNANAGTVQAALEAVIGVGNVAVTGGPAPDQPFTITFGGAFARQTVVQLQGTSNLTGGTNPGINVETVSIGGTPLFAPTEIVSSPNSPLVARDGNNAHARVIIDGSQTGGATGFVLNTSHSVLRGLIIDGFGIGVSVPSPNDVGNIIEGNYIGKYLVYPVDPNTGDALPAPNDVALVGMGNSLQGIDINANNTTVGGSNPQENNIISGNGLQGIVIESAATGNVVEGNQIGIISTESGRYFQVGNHADGVLVYGTSNQIGGPIADAGNLISANLSHGIRISGSIATRNIIAANIIGLGPGGGYLFGTGNPGNGDNGDGVHIEGASDNQIGGPTADWGNTISSNSGSGVYITDLVSGTSVVRSIGNVVLNNLIGVTSDGSAAKGNAEDGVTIDSFVPIQAGEPSSLTSQTVIGPGNLISGNLRGVRISGPGPGAKGVVVRDNLIGTDRTGTLDLGNAHEGVLIDNATSAVVEGNSNGSQVISGNLVGVAIVGSSASGNLVQGNFIGTDSSGLNPLPNAQEGVSIIDASGNTIGGTTSSTINVISGNHWGVRLGGSATSNVIEGNFIGIDVNRKEPIPNEIDGIVINASGNTIGGTVAGAGNTIAYNLAAGVSVGSGTSNSILTNSIFSNGTLGIELVASGSPPPNNLQAAPVLSQVTSDGTSSTHIVGSLVSTPNATFLIQFFSNLGTALLPAPQGQAPFAPIPPTEITTNGSGFAAINLVVPSPLAPGAVLTATATNVTTGDTSEFSTGVSQAIAIGFVMSTFIVDQTSGFAVISVSRTQDVGISTVQYATVAGGTAVPGVDYTPTSGTLIFQPGQLVATFDVVVINTHLPGGLKTVDLALSNPTGGVIDFNATAVLEITHLTGGLSGLFTVTNTNDSGPGSLRQAIIAANTTPGLNDISFAIPAATDPNLSIPVPGFDPSTQDWTITLQSPLPPITDSVSIDGYTQGEVAVPFRYPAAISSAVQEISINGFPTGGTFTLTTSAPLPVGTTVPIPLDAAPEGVQVALEAVIGAGNVSVTGIAGLTYSISFQGNFAHTAIPNLIPISQLTGGQNPTVTVSTFIAGGVASQNPTLIQSSPNTTQAIDGNDAKVRVIIDGSKTGDATGFLLEASNSVIRGLAIDGFGIGISVPASQYVGDKIQGDFLGRYLAYPVDPDSGTPLQAPNDVVVAGLGNAFQGVYLNSDNTTVGGTNPQENNVISGNGQQGVWIDAEGTGDIVEGNQIGVIGPSTNGLYFDVGNGAEGVLVNGSSNLIGGSGPAAGNVISANLLAGVRISGSTSGATSNTVAANFIGIAPGGGYKFGSGNPGNGGDGVRIEDSGRNQVGGSTAARANTISSNFGAGVYITGASSVGNVILGNLIGVTSDGQAAKGNAQEGVADFSPGTIIGPGNVISGNLRGVLISGSEATGVVVRDNLIGTDSTGTLDLGNSMEGVLIENATDAVIEGNSSGSQVISGNLVGVSIVGPSASGNLVQGNFIGTDSSGLNPLPNAQQGILVDGAPENTVGGTTTAARNVISANQWGIQLDGSAATGNHVEGNLIGTGADGLTPLGNEVDGVLIIDGAANNLIGGLGTGQGNTIAFNAADGVQVNGPTSIGNGILSNRIFANGGLGIDLVPPNPPLGPHIGPNHLQPSPVLTLLTLTSTGVVVQGTLSSMPDTSYLIQFFLTAPGNSSIDGELLGATTVTTDGNGNASFSVALAFNIAAGEGVVATATDPGDNTSEFSTEVINQPAILVFSMADYTVNQAAGVAVITVDREGGGGVVTVAYATAAGGTAVPGVDYTPVSGTLTFGFGVTMQSFVVPIIDDPTLLIDKTVKLVLSSPTGGAELGTPSSAILTIVPIPAADRIPPAVTGVQLITNRQQIVTGIVVSFSKPLNPTTAVNLLNYNYSVTTAGRNHVFGTRDNLLIPILTAVYNPINLTVTLTLGRGIHPATPFRLAITS